MADEQQDDKRGQGFPQTLHDRARSAAEELLRLLLSLSTGGIGICFLALTTHVDPPLSGAQQIVVVIALAALMCACLSGIFSWFADSRRNFFWASALQAEDKQTRTQFYKLRDRWLYREKVTGTVLIWMFIVGIIASTVYLALRIFRI